MRVVTRIVLAGMMLAAGCSDDGDTADPSTTTTPPPTTSTTTTSSTTTSTTVASTTSTSPTTTSFSADGSTTSSTQASTTTNTDNPLLTEEAVVDAASAIDAAFARCGEALPDCDLNDLDNWYTGEQLRQAKALFTAFNNEGFRVRNLEGRRLVVSLVGLEAEGSGEDPFAQTVECVFDDSVIYVVDDTGNETIVEDGLQTTIYERTYVLEDGRWKLRNSFEQEAIAGQDRCPS